MVISCILALAAIVFVIYAFVYDDEPWPKAITWGVIFAALVFAISYGIVRSVSAVPLEACNIEMTDRVEIVALKDNPGVNGSQFLLSGSVKSELYYYYAVETELGYRVENVPANNCYVLHSDETPCIESYSVTGFKNWYSWIYAVPNRNYKIIKVPDGTFQSAFEVDLE